MTYRAILRGNRLEWSEDEPKGLSPDKEVPVIVTVLDESTSPDRGARMADALERIAAAGGPTTFGDPLDWERQSRRERPLPGRD